MSLRPEFHDPYYDQTANSITPSAPIVPEVFSWADADVNLILPWYVGKDISDYHVVLLKDISFLSLSRNRATYPVSGLGSRPIRGFTKGPRMTAGSMGFVTNGNNPFEEAIIKYQKWLGNGYFEASMSTVDELPPMDLLITMANEDGSIRALWLKSIVFVEDNRTLDTNNPQMMESYSFMAAEATNWYRPKI